MRALRRTPLPPAPPQRGGRPRKRTSGRRQIIICGKTATARLAHAGTTSSTQAVGGPGKRASCGRRAANCATQEAKRRGRRLAVQRRRRSSLAGDGCASSTPRRQGRADRKTYARKVFRVSRLKSLVFRKLASETISKPQPSPKRQCSHQALSSWLATTPTKGHPHPANPTAKIWKTRILRHNQPISFPKAR